MMQSGKSEKSGIPISEPVREVRPVGGADLGLPELRTALELPDQPARIETCDRECMPSVLAHLALLGRKVEVIEHADGGSFRVRHVSAHTRQPSAGLGIVAGVVLLLLALPSDASSRRRRAERAVEDKAPISIAIRCDAPAASTNSNTVCE